MTPLELLSWIAQIAAVVAAAAPTLPYAEAAALAAAVVEHALSRIAIRKAARGDKTTVSSADFADLVTLLGADAPAQLESKAGHAG